MPELSLPAGWNWKRLSDVCSEHIVKRNPTESPQVSFEYVDISSIDNRTKSIRASKKILGHAAPSRARQVIATNDVLVSTTRPNLNAVALVPESLNGQICSTGFCVLRATPEIDPHFLYYWVQSIGFVTQLSKLVQGALYPAVTDRQVRAQYIPVPPIDEQRNIAALLARKLSVVERMYAAVDQQLSAMNELAKTAMDELFRDRRLTRVKRCALGTVCKLVNGNAYSGSDWSTKGLPIIRIQNLNDSSKPFNFWAGSLKGQVIVEPGDVLLAWSGTPGTSFGAHRWHGSRGVLNQHIFRVDLDKDVLDPDWAVIAINEQLEEMIDRAHGAVGLRHITKRDTLALQIAVPEKPIQRDLANINYSQTELRRKVQHQLNAQLQTIQRLGPALLNEAVLGRAGSSDEEVEMTRNRQTAI